MRTGFGLGLPIPSGNYISDYNTLLRDGNVVAQYIASMGVTGTLNASAWANQIGAAGSLTQGTGANQPVVLQCSGKKYSWHPKVAGNYLSTPDSTASSITGDIDIRAEIMPDNWIPPEATSEYILTKASIAGQQSYVFALLQTTGYLYAYVSVNGTAIVQASSTVATGFSVGTKAWVRVTVDVDNGSGGNDFKFYTSTDGTTWTQLGSTVTNAGTTSIFDGTSTVNIGQYPLAGAQVFKGKIYRAQVYNGIAGTLAVDYNPNDSTETMTNGATFVSSGTGETWTLTNTAINTPSAIVSKNYIVTDGSAYKMAASFTLNQPCTIYMVGIDPAWTIGKYIMDGASGANTLGLAKTTATPDISINAGSSVATNADLTLRSRKVVIITLNGASSSIQVGSGGTPTTGNAGAGNPGGLTIGADGAGANYGGFWFNEILVRSGADSAGTISTISTALEKQYGI